MTSASLPPAYVLGGGLVALSIARSLGRHGIPVTIFREGEADISFHSRYVRGVALGRAGDALSTVGHIVDAARKERLRPVLFVAGDNNLLTACRHEVRLREHVHLVLPPGPAAETVVSKERFQEFAAAHAVPVPRGWNPATVDQLLAVAGDMDFPVVLKPVRSADWHDASIVALLGYRKMVQVDDRDRLLEEWTRICACSAPPLIQEYVRGGDDAHFSYVSYRDRSSRELAGFTVQKLRLHPIHGGFATLVRVVREPAMATIGRRVLDQLGYRGAASVCFKRDAVSGEPRIFEINGRLPVSHGASQLVGIDLPWLMYRDALGLPHEPVPERVAAGYWLALTYDLWALQDYRRAGELTLRDWLRSLLQVRQVVEFDPRDPGPFGYFLRDLLLAGIGAVRKRARSAAKRPSQEAAVTLSPRARNG